MRRISIISALSLIVLLTGLLVMTRWIIPTKWIINIIPGQVNMMFNSALCFFFAGLAVFVGDQKENPYTRLYLFSGILLVFIAVVTLLQYVLNMSLGVDELFVQAWADNKILPSGRMAANTAAAFLFTGATLILFSQPFNQYRAYAMQVSIICVGMLGISALFGYALDFSILYSWLRDSKMAVHTAICFCLLSWTLWLAWRKNKSFDEFYLAREDNKILLLSTVILISIAAIASLLGFVISAKQDESAIKQYIQESLHDRSILLKKSIDISSSEVNSLKSNAEFKKIIFAGEMSQNDPKLTALLLNTTFSSIRIHDNHRHLIYSAGDYLANPEAVIPLKLNNNSRIVWDGRFYLEQSTAMQNGANRRVVTLQWPINIINDLIKSTSIDANRGYYLCFSSAASTLTCLPPKYSRENAMIRLTEAEKVALLSTMKLSKSNVYEVSQSSADHLIIAYSPIGAFGAGLVVKSDLTALYQPVTYRLTLVILVLLAVVFLGIFLINWVVAPLVKNMLDVRDRLQKSEERFRLSFHSSAVGMALIATDGRWLKVNQTLCDTLGYSGEELLQRTFQDFVYSADIDSINAKMHEVINGSAGGFKIENRYLHHDGRIIWMLVSAALVFASDAQSEYFILSCQDTTKEKESEFLLRYQARHDVLTGLVNRVELEERLSQIISLSQRKQTRFAVFFMDLDKFKHINDTLGHEAGDRLLKVIAERLASYTRQCDVVCRLGGDEFVMVLTDLHDLKSAAFFAERVINLLVKPIIIGGCELFVTSSIGISFYPDDGVDSETLVKNADLALYRAKELGRNNYQFCAPEVSASI